MAPGIFSRIFGGSGRQGTEDEFVPGEKISRRSTGFNEFIRAISREEGLKILDLGSTSPANITFMTGLGHKFHQEDVLRSATDKSLVIPNGDGGTTIDVHRYFDENLDFEREEFDAVMFWDLADFLPEPLVKPLIERIQVAMKPGGILFALFHTKDAGPRRAVLPLQHRLERHAGTAARASFPAAAHLQQPACREPVPRILVHQVLPRAGQYPGSAGD